MSNHSGSSISSTTILPTPQQIQQQYPLSEAQKIIIQQGREDILDILTGQKKRFLMILGPCSIDDPASCQELGEKIVSLQKEVKDDILLIMRVYIEKPRTRLGWKGFLIDPAVNGEHDPAQGISLSRKLMSDLSDMGILIATEFLTPF